MIIRSAQNIEGLVDKVFSRVASELKDYLDKKLATRAKQLKETVAKASFQPERAGLIDKQLRRFVEELQRLNQEDSASQTADRSAALKAVQDDVLDWSLRARRQVEADVRACIRGGDCCDPVSLEYRLLMTRSAHFVFRARRKIEMIHSVNKDEKWCHIF